MGRPIAHLNHVRGPVEASGHDSVEVVPHRRAVGELDFIRDHRPAQANPGETRVLGERIHLRGENPRACERAENDTPD